MGLEKVFFVVEEAAKINVFSRDLEAGMKGIIFRQ